MIAKLQSTRTRRAFSAAEFTALEAASIFAGYPDAAWANDDLYRADDGTPYLFSVEQYHRMIAAALLGKYDRVELIEGEVLEKMSIGIPHAACIDNAYELFVLRIGRAAKVRSQTPIVLAASEPEPDLSVVVRLADGYRSGKPTAADTLLVIEMADSSLDFDLGTKAGIYATNAIPEYWIVDLVNDLVHVHRGPIANGTWATITQHGRGETLTVAALNVTVTVAELLP